MAVPCAMESDLNAVWWGVAAMVGVLCALGASWAFV